MEMNKDVIELRLITIENTLSELKDCNTKLIQIFDKVANLEERVADLSGRMSRNSERIMNLEQRPAQAKADVVDQIIKIVLAAGVGFILVRLGIQ